MGGYRDKVVLISGSSRGVGRALAARLVAEGARVVLGARGEQRLLETRDALRRAGGQVEAVAGDVGRRQDAERLVAAAVDRFGRLDAVVNNAGVSMRGEFAELDPAVCERVIQTNLLGSVYLSRAAAEQLIAARGQLLFVSSIAGLFGLPGASVYCASKMALTGLAESLRIELAAAGVHVGVIYLGFTEHDPQKRILAADGSPVPPDRPAHHSQDEAAGLILDMMRRRRRELVMTPVGQLGRWVHRLSPGLVERAIRWARSSRWGLYEKFS